MQEAARRGRLFAFLLQTAVGLLLQGFLAVVILISCCSSYVSAEEQSPYGSSRSGYGELHPVKTVTEARKLLKEYFSKKDVVIGKITEQELYFEASILDKKETLIDRVIIDKRTGRIRSIY